MQSSAIGLLRRRTAVLKLWNPGRTGIICELRKLFIIFSYGMLPVLLELSRAWHGVRVTCRRVVYLVL